MKAHQNLPDRASIYDKHDDDHYEEDGYEADFYDFPDDDYYYCYYYGDE